MTRASKKRQQQPEQTVKSSRNTTDSTPTKSKQDLQLKHSNKKRKLNAATVESTPVSKSDSKSKSKAPSTDDSDKEKISKHDLRFNFSNILNQEDVITHPSPLTIDIHTEMKIQRQTRLMKLGLERSKELDLDYSSSENEESDSNNNNLFDDYLNLSSSEDEEALCYDSIPKYASKLHFQSSSSSPVLSKATHDLLNLATGLEQVDRIIKQFNDSNPQDPFTLISQDQFAPSNTTEDDDSSLEDPPKSPITPIETTLASHSVVKKKGSFSDLISDTSSFNLLTNRDGLKPLSTRSATITLNNTTPELIYHNSTPPEDNFNSEQLLDQFLNIEDDSLTSNITTATTPSSPSSETSNILQAPIRQFQYRYSDKHPLTLISRNNTNSGQMMMPKNVRRALNKRALFYGNHVEMVNSGAVSMNEFLI